MLTHVSVLVVVRDGESGLLEKLYYVARRARAMFLARSATATIQDEVD